jgi:hypothetical protein
MRESDAEGISDDDAEPVRNAVLVGTALGDGSGGGRDLHADDPQVPPCE